MYQLRKNGKTIAKIAAAALTAAAVVQLIADGYTIAATFKAWELKL
jgi:hypothetical protein